MILFQKKPQQLKKNIETNTMLWSRKMKKAIQIKIITQLIVLQIHHQVAAAKNNSNN